MKTFKTIIILLALFAAGQMSGAVLAGNDQNVQWVSNRAAEIYLYTGENYLQYSFNGEGVRDNETMPGAVDLLAINFFSIYYNLAENVEITHASLQYMITFEGDGYFADDGVWKTIECNELNTLVSSRTNTYRSTFNEQRIVTRDLESGDYVLHIMFKLTDADGNYYILGKDNDNFVFSFTVNDLFPDILGISMSMTFTPEQEVYPWVEAGVPFETIDLTNEDPLLAMMIDEVIIFAQGRFTHLGLEYKVCDNNDNELYNGYIPTTYDDFGNWSSDTRYSYEIIKDELLTHGRTYNFYFWAFGEGQDDQQHILDNYEENYRIKFVYGGGEQKVGDVNGDGNVDVADVNAIINIILKANEDNPSNVDVNGDGKVDVTDVNAIINIILGGN